MIYKQTVLFKTTMSHKVHHIVTQGDLLFGFFSIGSLITVVEIRNINLHLCLNRYEKANNYIWGNTAFNFTLWVHLCFWNIGCKTLLIPAPPY